MMTYAEEVMTPQTWRVFQLRYDEGLSYRHISEQLGISQVAVYKHLAQALQIAAVFIGLIMLSGITIAAIQYVKFLDDKKTTVQTTTVASGNPDAQAPSQQEPTDTLRTFENEELEDILAEVADYYHLRTQYRDDQSRHIRLYIKWNKLQSAEVMVDRLNGFEKVNVTLENDLLTAE